MNTSEPPKQKPDPKPRRAAIRCASCRVSSGLFFQRHGKLVCLACVDVYDADRRAKHERVAEPDRGGRGR